MGAARQFGTSMARVAMRGLPLLGLALASCAHIAAESAKAAAEKATPLAVTETLRTIETPENRKMLQQFFSQPEVRDAARHVGTSFTDGMLTSIADHAGEIKFDINPENFGRRLARGFVFGTDEALQELDAQVAQGQRTGLVARMTRAADTGIQVTTILLIILGVLLLGLVVWVVRLTVHTRHDHAEAIRREAALEVMARALRQTESTSWSPELREALETEHLESEAKRKLREMASHRHDHPTTH